jgi:hypothetical protein
MNKYAPAWSSCMLPQRLAGIASPTRFDSLKKNACNGPRVPTDRVPCRAVAVVLIQLMVGDGVEGQWNSWLEGRRIFCITRDQVLAHGLAFSGVYAGPCPLPRRPHSASPRYLQCTFVPLHMTSMQMDKASKALAQRLPASVPRSFRTITDHTNVPHPTLHARARGRRSIEA